MTETAIRTEGLTKVYKEKSKKPLRALNNLKLEIKKGTTFGFIGPNGAGKTTTIKILIGLIFPTSGKAYLFDKSTADPEARRSIGYLSEVAAYSPTLEAEELLLAFGAMHGMEPLQRRRRACEMLELVGLSDRGKSRLGEYSKGMLERFGIAQALLHGPSALILDEPTSGLDPIGQRGVLDVLHRLKDQGITIFFSSHRLVEVESLCDEVGIVSLGDLIFQGTLSQLEAQKHKTTFLIRFESKNGNTPYRFASEVSKILDERFQEVAVDQPDLDKTIQELHASGLKISSVLPRHSPLEDIFIELVTQHQGASTPK